MDQRPHFLMAFEAVKPPREVPDVLGISASFSGGDHPGEKTVRFWITRNAQIRHLGREIDFEKDRIDVQRGTEHDLGKIMIRISPDGALRPRKMARGTMLLIIQAFPPVPPKAVSAMQCVLIESAPEENQVVVRLPWRDGSVRR